MVSRSDPWGVGDLVNEAGGRYGERYAEAMRATGLTYATLTNYAWTARRIPPARRRERLSFRHHMEVAALGAEAQDRWLAAAEARGWSAAHLRRVLARCRPPRRPKDLYFASSRCGRFVKIGVSDDPPRRADALDVVLLRVVPEGEHLEARLHRRFRRLRVPKTRIGKGVSSEWFRAEPVLTAYVDRLA